MSRYKESQHPRSQDGRWRHKPAAAPAASLEDQAPTQVTKSRRPARPKTGVVRTSLAQLSAPETLAALSRNLTSMQRREKALRRALVERKLQRVGALKARLAANNDNDQLVIEHLQVCAGVTVDEQALQHALNHVADAIDGQVDTPPYLGIVDPWRGHDRVIVMAGDRVDQARTAYDRASQRLHASAAAATTAICLEAERQGAGHLDVEDGGVMIHETGQPLAVEGGQLAELVGTDGELGLPRHYVQDLPGVYPSEDDDSSWSVNVAEHLASQDVQVPGQTYFRV